MSDKNTITTIDQYISAFPEKIRYQLQVLRDTIKQAAPEADEKISYQMPTFYLKGNLVHFAAYKNHIGFYPTPSGIQTFKEELSAYESSKGAVKFPIGEALPLELISRIVKYRMAENLANAEKKKS